MPHIARLDEQGMLLGIEDCCHEDHKTCPIARTVALEEGHDMHQRAKGYRWDFTRACFLPLSAEPLEAAERDTAELVEGIVEALEHIEATLKVVLPKRTRRVIQAYRRRSPKQGEPVEEVGQA